MVQISNSELALITAQPAKAGVESAGMLVSNIGAAASGIVSSLLTAFAGATLDSLKGQVRDYLGRNMSLAGALKSINQGDITDAVEELLQTDYTNIIDLMKGGIAQGVGSVHGALYETLNGTNALTSSYIGLIQRLGIDPFISRWVNRTIRPNWLTTESAWFATRLGALDVKSYHVFAANEGWEDAVLPVLEETWYQPLPLGILIDLKRRDVLSMDDFTHALRWYRLKDSDISSLESLLTQVPEPYRIADFGAKLLIDDSRANGAFKWFGLDPYWYGIYKESAMQVPSFSVLAEMKWRGIIDDGRFNFGLQRAGVHPSFMAEYRQLLEQIPPAQDIITMVVREAFEASNILPAPTDFATWMLKKGFSNFWADKYWTAHFAPMPLNQAYDNLRRGYWNEAKFKDLLRIADIHPRWHDDILKVAFYPPTVRELGYGYDTGAYTQADIETYRRWGGLSAIDAKKSAQALVDYRLDAERNSLRTGYMNEFITGMMDEKSYREKLVILRTNQAAIDLWIERATVAKALKPTQTSPTEPKEVTRADIQWLFENGLRDESWFKKELQDKFFSAEAIQVYLDQSKKRIADKLAPSAPVLPKQVTLSQLTEFYFADIIKEQELKNRIVALNYTEADANAIVQIIIKSRPVKVKALTIPQLTKMYYDGELDDAKLLERLMAMNYTQEDAQSLVDLIRISKPQGKAAPTMSLSEIEELYRYAYFDEQELLKKFEDRGFSHSDAALKTYLALLSFKIPILTAQYRNAWIGEQDLYNGILDLNLPYEAVGIPQKRVDEMFRVIVKNTQAERLVKEKDLTKAEILKGAKNNVFTPAQAVELLENLGYSLDEANYLLAINKIVAVADPKGYWDARQAVELWKKSVGISSVEIPEQLITLEAELKNRKAALKLAKDTHVSEIEIGARAVEVANTEAAMSTIKIKLKIK